MICILPTLDISTIALIVAFLTFLLTFFSIRMQIISLILTLLSDKARECSNYIDSKTQIVLKDTASVSAILSTIIISKQLLYRNYKSFFLFLLWIGRQSCIDQFYLQLHTSIRLFIRDRQLPEGIDPNLKSVLERQIIDSNKILTKSIKKFQ
jgi:hypothetical protein